MKITLPISALAAVLGLALASAPVTVQAATTTPAAPAPAAAPKATKYSGTLTAVDTTANTITISDKTLAPRTFTITPATKIKKDGKVATLADFKVGDKVGGSYTGTAPALTATTLNTSAAKKTEKTAKAKTPATTDHATPAAQ